MSRFPTNDVKFQAVRALQLPLGHYAITSSGILGIRDIRAIGDVDIIVDDWLWADLSQRYPVTRDNGFDRIPIGSTIEIFGRDSFLAPRTASPTVFEQIQTADIINGLPFVRLEYVLHFKRHVLLQDPSRTKHANDRVDIQAIQRLLTGLSFRRDEAPTLALR